MPCDERINKGGGVSMTELEKCMAGELYNCHDEIFLQYKKQAKELLDIYYREVLGTK